MPWFTADKTVINYRAVEFHSSSRKHFDYKKTALELTTFELFLEQVEELKCVK